MSPPSRTGSTVRPGGSFDSVHVPESTAVPVAAGHPWVYREPGVSPRVGAVLHVLGPRGRALGWGIGDDGPIAVRVLGRGEPEDLAPFVARVVARSDAMRRSLLGEVTDAWRVVNGEGDGLGGLVVDRYGDLAVVRLYARAWEPHLGAIVDAVRALPWARHGLRRLGVGTVDGAEGAEALWGRPPADVVVHEAGLRFRVRPGVGQKTGMFLDLREQRARVRRISAGAEVVNLFCYAGALSVAAAVGGARRVVSVDIAPAAIDDARDAFRLNGLDPDAHGFVVADAFAWRADAPVGALVVDPPALARRQSSVGAAVSAYRKLAGAHRDAVIEGGWLLASSCTARVSLVAWRDALRDGLGPGWTWCETGAEPIDHPVLVGHPEGRYLKTALLRRLG